MAASAQIANHYGLVSSVASGMTDAKTMDAQAGYEKGITITAAALAGGNLVSAYPGIVGSLMGQSFEGLVIDNDLLGNAQRLLRGIEVTDETLSYEVIAAAVKGAGHYLGADQTLAAHAQRVPLPGSRGSHESGRVAGGRQPDHLRTRPRSRRGDPGHALPRVPGPRGRRADPRAVPDPPRPGRHAAGQRPLVGHGRRRPRPSRTTRVSPAQRRRACRS